MVTAAIGSVLGALGSQRRNPDAYIPPRPDTSTLAISSAGSDRAAKRASRNAERERIFELLRDPAVIGMITLIGGVMAAENIPLSGNDSRDVHLRSVLVGAVILMSLTRAGAGDLTTLAVATTGGLASEAGGMGISDIWGIIKAVTPL